MKYDSTTDIGTLIQEEVDRKRPKEQKMTAGARLIQQAGEPRLDGLITPGEILTYLGVMFFIPVGGVMVGTAVGLLFNQFMDGLKVGFAGGAILACAVVVPRVIADLWWVPRAPTYQMPEQTDEPPERKGIDVWIETVGSGEVKKGTILKDLPQHLVVEMLTAVARDVIEGEQRVSKRQAGSHFGDHYGTALAEMIRAGLLVQAGKGHNAGYDLTDAGREWLKGFL